MGQTVEENKGEVTLTSTNVLQAVDVSIWDLDECKANFTRSRLKQLWLLLKGEIEPEVKDGNICAKNHGKCNICVVSLHRNTKLVIASFHATRVILEDHWCALTRKTKRF